mmetsp:Transcript_38046/g.56923  ORF Transcript_38046/g.56923 Transcript_38046/m.56923 type:complete len:121 (-) Transcript_38046:1624-1986(-)
MSFQSQTPTHFILYTVYNSSVPGGITLVDDPVELPSQQDEDICVSLSSPQSSSLSSKESSKRRPPTDTASNPLPLPQLALGIYETPLATSSNPSIHPIRFPPVPPAVAAPPPLPAEAVTS